MGQRETHMLVFNLLEILFSQGYWDGQLPASSSHMAQGLSPEDRPVWGLLVQVLRSMSFPRV